MQVLFIIILGLQFQKETPKKYTAYLQLLALVWDS
jgi:small basic protein